MESPSAELDKAFVKALVNHRIFNEVMVLAVTMRAGVRSSAARGTAIRRVGDLLNSVEDIFANPKLLDGKTPADLLSRLSGGTPKGWRVETLGKGSHQGEGFILREFNEKGAATSRMIQWHPGGGNHGPSPYWKVSSPRTGTIRVGPQFE